MADKMAAMCAKEPPGAEASWSSPETAGQSNASFASIMTYEKTKTRANMKGELYEVKMAAMLFLRLVNCETILAFNLATNVEGAGALDDVVITYSITREPTVKQSVFIQLKHKEKAILRKSSFSGKTGDFALKKYFKSYLDIKNCMLINESSVLFDGNFLNCHFVIHTNAHAHSELSERSRDVGKCELQDLLKSGSERGLIFQFDDESHGDVISFITDVENNFEEAKEFLKSLTVFSGQLNESQLDKIIKEELLRACPGKTKTEIDLIYPFYEDNFKHWWSHSSLILDQDSKILSDAIGKCKINTLSPLQEKYFCLDLKFRNILSTDSLDEESLLHLVPPELSTRVLCTKLVRSLQNIKGGYIFLGLDSLLREREAVMSAWSSWTRHLLVVVSESSERHEDLCHTLCKHLKKFNEESCVKKIIVVSAPDDSFTASLKTIFPGTCKEVQDRFQLEQLDPVCRSHIENRDVSFQGVLITLGEILKEGADSAPGVFNDEFLRKVLTTETISLGLKLDETVFYYIPRTLERRDIIRKDILKENYPNEEFIVRGPDETFEDAENPFEKKVNVHKLTMCSDGNLKWCSTEGSIDKINKFIVEECPTLYNPNTALDLQDRVILITAEPGMGKSTILTDLASKTKRAHPSLWVVRIDLKDHMDELDQLNDDVVGYLSSAVGISSSGTENELFRFMMETGKCVVLLDGFDEIAPDYTDAGISLLTSLMKTRAIRIYVTSRHALKSKLEAHLQTLTFTLRKFDATDQRLFFKKFWTKDKFSTKTDHQLEQLVETLVELIARSLNDADKEFMGTPLLTMMVAEIYEDYFKKQNTANDLPLELDIITMFEQVIDKKFNIYLWKLHLDDVKNIRPITKRHLKSVTENHIHASLYLLLGIERLGSLHKGRTIIGKYQEFTETIHECEYQPGIIVKVLNGKPIFLHRTFAEYFFALWFFHNQDVKNQDFLRGILFNSEFKVIRRFFDLMLARKSPLLTAVVNEDLESVELLLSRGEEDVNSVDLGGRSAMHLGAVISARSEHQYITYNFWNRFVGPRPQSMVQLLLSYGACAHGTDTALGWNVIEYAVNTKSWQALEHLLWYLTEERAGDCSNVWERYDCLQWNDTLLERYCYEGDVITVQSLITSLEDNMKLLCMNNSPTATGQDGSSFTQLHPDPKSLVRVTDAVVKYINAQATAGFSALFNAAMKGHSPVIRILVANGADIWVREDDGETPLHAVFRYIFPNNSPNTLTSSIRKNIVAVNTSQNTAQNKSDIDATCHENKYLKAHNSFLEVATSHSLSYTHNRIDKTDSAQALIANLGLDDAAKYINAKNHTGFSALHYASKLRQSVDIKLLVSKGGDVWSSDDEGRTPLHASCEVGNVDTARALLESLPVNLVAKYINLKDSKGNSALCYSSRKGSVEAITLLVSKGGDLWTRNDCRQTPLHVGSDFGVDRLDATTALIASLAENEVTTYINVKDVTGRTALHISSYMGNLNEIQLFLLKGGDVWELNDEGQTPLHEVCKSYHSEVKVAQILVETLGDKDVEQYINTKDYNGKSAKDLILENNFIQKSKPEMRAALMAFLEETVPTSS